MTIRNLFIALLLLVNASAWSAIAQAPAYPKEIRGYKIERAVVELKKDPKQTAGDVPAADEDALLRLGDPKMNGVTPLGITLEVPIVVSPVKQKGHVDFLMFEDVTVNGTSVEIDEYQHSFELPNKKPLTLNEPLKIYINLPGVLFGALGEWSNSKETWVITGRVYVFGKFNKSFLKFKRCIPVELKMNVPNPIRKQDVR